MDIIDKKSIMNNNNNNSLTKCLGECEIGDELEVIKVDAGGSATQRLASLGIVPGVKIIKSRSAPFNGPIEIIVKGTKIVLGRGLVSKIIVSCNNSCNL
ncbi:MAG: ferrous iron transport protein A [Candidatus Lokiarchaeota archaeon]|nr:ferrous iron transport protein A [Candidatus Lokiarchaeota archaeon]